MSLRRDLLGAESSPVEFHWDHDDVMLYAVAVGAGQEDPARELEFTTENVQDVRPQVLPAFANIVTRGAQVDLGDYDRSQLVHVGQSFGLHAQLPVAGHARVAARVTGVYDKGSAAIVQTEATAVDAATGAPLATTVGTVLIRGEGGFGGPRGESFSSPAPDRSPDFEITYATRPEQALIFRLTGDRNPLHVDPAFARRGGFDRPILHGMCTYGFTARALLHAVCDGDPQRFRMMSARFTMPVLPGAELTVSIWRDGQTAVFRTMSAGHPVLDSGSLEIGPPTAAVPPAATNLTRAGARS